MRLRPDATTNAPTAAWRRRGMETPLRPCNECGSPLPPTATTRRKFCSPTCRRRSNDREHRRARQKTETQRLSDQLDEARAEISRKESQLANARKTIAAERTQLRRQEAKARKRERQQQAHAQRAITARVKNLVSTRDRLAAVKADLEAATTGPIDRSDLEIAAQQILDLQNRLATVADRQQAVTGQYVELRDRFESLVTEYNKAAQKLSDMARDRQRFRPVIEAWDTLVDRLARSAKPAALSPGDREIVRMWATWKAGRDRRIKAGQ
ncbi:hypothetical protein [Brevibacterium sp. SMBL_HHYL_HB1]|uniref:hypothetical protein n=1 Tax=Brevibacterium sp. SMBL_HHYL_HB1 TaxID=2777556 RepID=UPI001BAE4319|nr:hypothetical protein [Brevibacterium sp. SMBL_HHYL_HB1]QUL78028.1 hypothetical protein IG171_11095 [Brevibacterium sp. SMBL_HHYL_HB1]